MKCEKHRELLICKWVSGFSLNKTFYLSRSVAAKCINQLMNIAVDVMMRSLRTYFSVDRICILCHSFGAWTSAFNLNISSESFHTLYKLCYWVENKRMRMGSNTKLCIQSTWSAFLVRVIDFTDETQHESSYAHYFKIHSILSLSFSPSPSLLFPWWHWVCSINSEPNFISTEII